MRDESRSTCPSRGDERCGNTDIIIPMPMNETEATRRTMNAAKYFASGIERSKKRRRTDHEEEGRPYEAVGDREHTWPARCAF